MYLKSSLGAALAVALAPAAFAQQASDSSSALKDVIVVTGTRPDTATETVMEPDKAPVLGNDLTLLSARTPGGARVANGELSGQMQYRGLFGERLNLRVDGQRFASGGPNLMDPAFHYAPAPLVAALVIDRGVSPVSEGPGLGGGADAVFKRIGYASGDALETGYDLSFGGRTVNDSFSTGGVAGASTDAWRFNLLGSYEEGGDTDFGGGVIGGTEFKRGVFGASAGVRFDQSELTFDMRRHEAGPAGNPPFPMDIRYMDTDFAKLGWTTQLSGVEIAAEANYADVAHAMNNFDLRPSPAAGAAWRETIATATTRGGGVSAAFDALGGSMKVGVDGDDVEHDALITNPNNANFFVGPFPNISLTRFGGFAEWTGELGRFESELGLRIDQNEYDAGDAVVGPVLPMGPQMLAMNFNSSNRSGEDTTVDAIARIWMPTDTGITYRATLAHKQKTPGYIQRFGWLPIAASGGLADGNIYVGDLTLEPESAIIVEGGFDFAGASSYLRPTIFLREIDNYIQGVPFDDTPGVIDTPQEMIANMNGDPTPLRWANVDARLYGIDFDFGFDINGPLRFDGLVSYVRGERRDIDDNLYRVAPLSVLADLTWEGAGWSATFEAHGVSEQDRVSLTNSEAPTPGYVVLSLYGDWQVRDGVRLSAGVENLLDHTYRDHLSGYNRNGFGDVPVGSRLPGAGRGAYLRLSIAR